MVSKLRTVNLDGHERHKGIMFYLQCNGVLVPVRTSFGLRRRGGKTYNVPM